MMRDLRDGGGMEDADGASRGRPRRRMDSSGGSGGGVSPDVWSSAGAFGDSALLQEFKVLL